MLLARSSHATEQARGTETRPQRAARLGLLAGLAFAVAACSSAAEPAPPPAVAPPPAPAPSPAPGPPAKGAKPFEIAWGTCSIPFEGGDAVESECATVDAPARRGVAGSGTLPVAVYRIKARHQPATAQLWLLNGGPGAAGFDLASVADIAASEFTNDVDAYFVDHRGTGESAYLACPRATQDATDLQEYARLCSAELRKRHGDAIDGFSTTESAHDVRELIDSTREPGKKVFVYGISYGSYWAHRLMQMPETKVDGVITDGNCLSSTCTFDVPQTFALDEPMREILTACKGDAACAAHLGDDPWRFAADTVQMLAGGHCSEARIARMAPADMMMSLGPIWGAGTAPLLFRLNRCSAADVKVLDNLATVLEKIGGLRRAPLPNLGAPPKPGARTRDSSALGYHVIASELISRPAPTSAELRALGAGLTFKPGPDSYDLAYFDSWSAYPRDALVGGWARRDVPWLMVQGTFDFQTVASLSRRAAPELQNPSLQYVRFDGGGHSVAWSSTCSMQILEAFMRDPKAAVDTSCVAELKASALRMDPRYVQYFFGTANAWD